MSKHKNFSIEFKKQITQLPVDVFNIGDIFHREGSLHMRVAPVTLGTQEDEEAGIWVCNLNTGSIWQIPANSKVSKAFNCKISYEIWEIK